MVKITTMSLDKYLVTLNRFQKITIMFFFDAMLLLFSLFFSYYLSTGLWYPYGVHTIFLIVIMLPVFIYFGLYSIVIRYIGLQSLTPIIAAISIYIVFWLFVLQFLGVNNIPKSFVFNNWLVSILVILGLRIAMYQVFFNTKNAIIKNVAIYGAGIAGVQLLSSIKSTKEIDAMAFIDDNPELHKRKIKGITVFPRKDIGVLIDKYRLSEIFIAMPSISKNNRIKIINEIELNYPVKARTLPGIHELIKGGISVDDLKNISIDDLLGRDIINANKNILDASIKDNVVMVTGAGGSIGSELCKQIIRLDARKLILYEQSELALYNIDKSLDSLMSDIDIIPVIGSINNQARIEKICKMFNVSTIYHAAAYKHVPLVEFNTTEGVFNNIFGTLSAVKAAINTNVKTFVLISTDKAVNPTNTMGATKRFSEIILQSISKHHHKTVLTMVRFGNVLGSSGSVIPLFKQQIKNGGPVTITDKKIIRYFMTIPEAVELVIQAGSMANGGDVFVLNMGKPVKIYDLAKKMIHLAGLKVKDETRTDGDIEIRVTGLRPGEKMFEELLISKNILETSHPMILRTEESFIEWKVLKDILDGLNEAVSNCDQQKIRELLIKAIPEFKPQCDIVDTLYRDSSLK